MIRRKKAENKGALILIGGAEDRREDKTVLRRAVEINQAQNIVVIPTATLYPVECGEDYYYAFRDLGVKNIQVFDIRDSREADREEYLEKINEADMIFFTGGDQVRLAKVLLNTQLMKKIHHRFLHEKVTIAGTSAGAAAAANPMTYDGDDQGLVKGSIKYDEGFGFIKDITIDTHFVARGRLGRLTQFLCNGYTHRGIGIGENTSINIMPDNTFEVVGTGIVSVVSTKNLSFSNFEEIETGEKISVDGIKLAFLQEGAHFDINKWKITKYNKDTSPHFKAVEAQ